MNRNSVPFTEPNLQADHTSEP